MKKKGGGTGQPFPFIKHPENLDTITSRLHSGKFRHPKLGNYDHALSFGNPTIEDYRPVKLNFFLALPRNRCEYAVHWLVRR